MHRLDYFRPNGSGVLSSGLLWSQRPQACPVRVFPLPLRRHHHYAVPTTWSYPCVALTLVPVLTGDRDWDEVVVFLLLFSFSAPGPNRELAPGAAHWRAANNGRQGVKNCQQVRKHPIFGTETRRAPTPLPFNKHYIKNSWYWKSKRCLVYPAPFAHHRSLIKYNPDGHVINRNADFGMRIGYRKRPTAFSGTAPADYLDRQDELRPRSGECKVL